MIYLTHKAARAFLTMKGDGRVPPWMVDRLLSAMEPCDDWRIFGPQAAHMRDSTRFGLWMMAPDRIDDMQLHEATAEGLRHYQHKTPQICLVAELMGSKAAYEMLNDFGFMVRRGGIHEQEMRELADRCEMLEIRLKEGRPMFVDGLTDTNVNPHGYFVYSLHNESGEIIYIGQSRNVFGRIGTHIASQPWRDEIATVRLTRWETLHEALGNEAERIFTQRPKYNIVHNAERPAA